MAGHSETVPSSSRYRIRAIRTKVRRRIRTPELERRERLKVSGSIIRDIRRSRRTSTGSLGIGVPRFGVWLMSTSLPAIFSTSLPTVIPTRSCKFYTLTLRTQGNELNDKFTFDANPLNHKIINDFTMEIDNSPNSNIEEVLSNVNKEGDLPSGVSAMMKVKINYPNGDYFEGEKDLNWKSMGPGEYRWYDGYTYKGEFFLSVPFGEGEYMDCLGVKRPGYFFRGYMISDPHGLDKLLEHLKTSPDFKRMKQGKEISSLETDDLELISDPELMKGSSIFKDFKVNYGLLYQDMMDAKIRMRNDMQNIRDGELDFEYNWTNKMRADIRQAKLKELDESGWNDKMIENPNLIRKDWIHDIKPKSIQAFETQQIFELVRDKDNDKFSRIYNKFGKEKLLHKLITSKDFSKKNMLMVAAELGHVQFFVDLLCALERSRDFHPKNLIKLLQTKDYEGNTIFDLLSIRGFDIEESEIFTVKVENKYKKEIKANNIDVDEEEKQEELEAKLKKEGKKGKKNKVMVKAHAKQDASRIDMDQDERKFLKISRDTGESFGNNRQTPWMNQEQFQDERIPKIFLDMIEAIKGHKGMTEDRQRRHLFVDDYINYKELNKMAEKSKEELKSTEVCFVSRRSVILFTLIEFMSQYNLTLDHVLRKKNYKNLNNPLHFSLFHGDLYTTLLLLRHKRQMMFWKNHKKQVPAQVIKSAGKNLYKAKAIFASILNEYTRHFNFKIIKKFLLEDLHQMKDDDKKNNFDVRVDKLVKRIHNELQSEEGTKKRLERDKKKRDKLKKEKAEEADQQPTLATEMKKESKKKKTKRQIKEMEEILSRNFFNYENVYLFNNNYILQSEELCKAYISHLKEKSRYSHLKKQYRVMKNYSFVEMPELEALQRNFLDFFKPGKSKGKLRNNYYICNQTQNILTWYVFIFGDAAIEPEIYERLSINPYKIVLDGKNIFHFMCENNSYSLLEKFISFYFDRCHWTAYDGTRETYAEWNKRTLVYKRYELFKQCLNIFTTEDHDTAAHICIYNHHYECLELLLNQNIDIDQMNLRGRSVRELLYSTSPYNMEAEMTLKPDDIGNMITESVKQDIFATCKQHSLAYEFIKGGKHAGIEKIVNRSVYQLDEDLTNVRDDVIQRLQTYSDDFQGAKIRFQEAVMFLNEIVEIQNLEKDEERKDRVKAIRQAYIDGIKYKEFDLQMNYNLITALEGNKFEFMEYLEIVKYLFKYEFIKEINNFKYSKRERLIKNKLLTILKKSSFRETVDPKIKDKFGMDQLLCIEIIVDPDVDIETIQENIVLSQIKNIRHKFMKYGGGMRIDLIKGHEYNLRKWYFFCPTKKIKWYILITPTEKLLTKIATDLQMRTYNMKEGYHTVYSVNSIDKGYLEPLRHHQKVQILMKLISEEFDIQSYIKKNLVTQFYPIHNYQERRAIYDMWSKNKSTIHFKDLKHTFNLNTDKNTLKFMSLISFYHGIQQGFYFGFFAFYNNFMFILAILGLFGIAISYIIALAMGGTTGNAFSNEVTIFYAPIAVGIWSTLFISFWKFRQAELSYSFDVMEEENVKQIRPIYKAEAIVDEGSFKISKKYKKRTFFIRFVSSLILTF